MRLILRLIIFVSVLCSLFSVLPSSAHALDLTNYFFPPTATGTNISSGEYFRAVDEGNGLFKIEKSRDPKYYERFRIQDGQIYHITETPWATEDGNVKCSNGHEANLGYKGGQTPWAPINMSEGSSFESSGEVVGIDRETGDECITPHNGGFTRKFKLTHQGCVTFPTGVTSDDAIVLEVTGGPGAGEQFFYDAGRGWIGFNRGADDTGNYVTDKLSDKTYTPGQCYEVTKTISKRRCPLGFTCPDTSNKVVFGETINYEKKVFGGYSGLSGATGPTQNDLRFPDFYEEAKLFMDSEIIARSMPFELLEKHLPNFAFPEFTFPNLTGILAHSGCEKVTVDGENAGDARIRNDELKRFPTTPDYNKLLLGFRFWESQYVEGKSANLKYNASQPDGPTVPEHRPGCNDRDGQSYQEATTVNNPLPPKNSLLNDLGFFIGKTLCELGDVVGLQVCATVSVKVQQEKYLPGEIAFSDQSHNFLDSFIPFEEKGQPVDQEEQNSYEVFSTGRVEGVNYLGAKSTQDKTLELVKSLRPYEEAKLITTLGPGGTLPAPAIPTAGLYYTIPHKDKSVEISPLKKQDIINKVLRSKSDSKIAEYWDIVYNAAKIAGVNPAFAIALWIEESYASSPTAYKDSDGSYTPAYSDFGCFPSGNPDDFVSFDRSLPCFIETARATSDFAAFAKTYCGPNQAVVCENNPDFLGNLQKWYGLVVPTGTHGAATSQ